MNPELDFGSDEPPKRKWKHYKRGTAGGAKFERVLAFLASMNTIRGRYLLIAAMVLLGVLAKLLLGLAHWFDDFLG